jgi:Calcineurin-like phosphoesterase
LLLGDAGESTLHPWSPSLKLAAELASVQPQKTSVALLGDNIYMQGYPALEKGQAVFDEEQLALIERLDAQLQISSRSGAELFLLPGNHDWLADQVDDQANHVVRYAVENNARVAFRPWKKGERPLPEVAHRPGLSLVFLDSEWLLTADQEQQDDAITYLKQLIAEIAATYPDNTVLVMGHHPLQTMGPHAEFYTGRMYAAMMRLIDLFFEMDQDITNPPYQRLIAALNDALTSESHVIYAAGHEHSLQVFQGLSKGPEYQLVSGAANASKISGVGHNEQTLFALSRAGLMQLSRYPEGVFLEVFDAHNGGVVHRQWLK